MPPPRVAFQGERGAYSEEALALYFDKEVETLPKRSIYEVFSSVEVGEAEFGIVPIENSIEGGVNETYDLLLESELKVAGEINLRIRHCLIANPGSELERIRVVYSHPQALGQCRRFLRELGVEAIPSYDTAGSVKMIKERNLKEAGAIASFRSAQIYGMQLLKEGIEDNPNNYTRFLLLSKRDAEPSGKDKTSIIFTTQHIPGALYRALKEFADRGINLTMIHSRPTKKTPWEYNFYVDMEGHREEGKVRACLSALRERTLFLKVLGSYPQSPWPSTSTKDIE